MSTGITVKVTKLSRKKGAALKQKLYRERGQLLGTDYSACVVGDYYPKHRCYYGYTGHEALKKLASAMARAGLLD